MPANNYDYLKESIETEAQNLGFFKVGFCNPDQPFGYQQYIDWLDKGFAADMQYLARNDTLQKRGNPRLLMENVKTIIVLAMSYFPSPCIEPLDSQPLISSYAWGKDYHIVIPQKMEQLAQWLSAKLFPAHFGYKIFTDTAPILERSLAVSAGIGWIGKHSCLIIPRAGSFFFLAELFVNIEFSPDNPYTNDLCGTCTRCIQACPTNCIQPNRTIDSNQCISYLTIENKKQISKSIHQQTGDWIFGCDICQQVCPWNLRFARKPSECDFAKSNAIESFNPIAILNMETDQFKEIFFDSPMTRAKLIGIKRNIINWMGNSARLEFLPHLKSAFLVEEEPIIRDQLKWAIEQLES